MMETAAPSRCRTISIVKAFAFALSKLASSAMPSLIGSPRTAGPQPRDVLRLAQRSDRQISAVDDELGSRDVRRLVRGEEQHGMGHLFHTPLALHRHGAEGFRAPLRI